MFSNAATVSAGQFPERSFLVTYPVVSICRVTAQITHWYENELRLKNYDRILIK